MKPKHDDKLLNDFLGETENLKIIKYLVEHKDQTLNDIIQNIKINRKKGYKILNKFIKNEVVIIAKKVKHINFYNLNFEKEEIKMLIKIRELLDGGNLK